jgi:hypothetical protein
MKPMVITKTNPEIIHRPVKVSDENSENEHTGQFV